MSKQPTISRFGIEFLRKTESNNDIAGFYVVDRSVTDSTPADWEWENFGNGPEIINDGVRGPFKTDDAAANFIGKLLRDETDEE